METFAKLFARFLVLVYHCFDRIVIQGHLPLLSRPEHIVHFFRDVHGQYPITPKVLAKRTPENIGGGWKPTPATTRSRSRRRKRVSARRIAPGLFSSDERRNQHRVYLNMTIMEMGRTFRSQMPMFTHRTA